MLATESESGTDKNSRSDAYDNLMQRPECKSQWQGIFYTPDN